VRAIVDTNVLISGLLWHGAPHRLIEQIRSGTVTLISSNVLLAELDIVLRRPKFRTILERTEISVDQLVAEVRGLADVIIDPPPLPAPASRDPDDDALLAVAVACRAEMIVTGDADLLTLGAYADIPIVDAGAALARVRT
jgi:putative PIN family toxin of toxin-antitoxin system